MRDNEKKTLQNPDASFLIDSGYFFVVQILLKTYPWPKN